ncbi:MAG: aminotransferase class I/II-fold pyridoxal phosphate-dependent enzyme [Ornithinimicrobium sp.]
MRPVPEPGQHGGDGPAVAAALGFDPGDLLDLSQNLNPFAPDVGALVGRRLSSLRRYPDPALATERFAAALGVDPGRLLLTNGGSEAIHLVATELGGRVTSEPEFALHPRGTDGPRWRSNPHSPSGVLAGPGERADVWDEAFYSLATGKWSADRPDAFVVGSLTKTFACPGLRLGYLLVPDTAVLSSFSRHQPRWSVSSLALASVPDLLRAADLPTWQAQIASARADLVALLQRRGFQVDAHAAPWVLVHDGSLRRVLAPHGVLVRDCSSFGRPDLTRIAVPDAAGLERLRLALDAILARR